MVNLKNVMQRFLSLMLTVLMVLTLLPAVPRNVQAASSGGTLTGLTDTSIGASYIASTDNTTYASWNVQGGQEILGSAAYESGNCGGSNHKTTLTLTNNKSESAVLGFTYTINSNGIVQVDGTTVTAGSTFTKELAAGESVKIYVASNGSGTSAKITLSSITLLVRKDVTTTFSPAENGTYTVGDKTITESYTNTQSSLESYAVKATPANGYKFVGWYSKTDDSYLSIKVSETFNFDSDKELTAVFTQEDNLVFDVGNKKFYGLDEATGYAVANKIEKVTLEQNGTPITGSHTIPSGVTLLIPFDDAHTLYKEVPVSTQDGSTSKKNNAFRTLTLAEGATLNVEGGISVGGRYKSASGSYSGYMTGNYGLLSMESGSTINVKNGGNLYAWGFVSGNGSVTAETGGTVWEWFQIGDFRGGRATMSMGNNVFPFSQYFIQNIEVPLTIQSGAEENVYTGVFASSKVNNASIKFIGDGGMFKINSGSLTKTYDGSTDRVVYTASGDVEMNSLSLNLAGSKVNSAKYVFPIVNNTTLNIVSGKVSVNQTLSLLAGTQVNVANGAELIVSSGKSIYVYDADEWNAANYTCVGKFASIPFAYSRTKNRSNADLVDAKVDVNGTLTVAGYVYTTAGGADICSSGGTGKYVQQTAPGTAAKTYQYTQSGNSVTEATISITAAKLRNGDDSYTETASASAGDTYIYKDNKWTKDGKIKVTFDANGGTGTMDVQEVDAGADTILTENSFTKEGYTFAHWNTAADDSGTRYEDKATVSLEEDTTLYAIWKEDTKEHTITFNANGGSGTMDALTVEDNAETTLTANAFSREGYTFANWNTAADGSGTSYADGAAISVTEDTTLYAIWTENAKTYTVTWVNEDGTELEKDENVTAGTTPEYNGETPAKKGNAQYSYKFSGWTPEVTAVSNDVTYKACFDQIVNEYTITWKNSDGTILETDQVPYGNVPAYKGTTPVYPGSNTSASTETEDFSSGDDSSTTITEGDITEDNSLNTEDATTAEEFSSDVSSVAVFESTPVGATAENTGSTDGYTTSAVSEEAAVYGVQETLPETVGSEEVAAGYAADSVDAADDAQYEYVFSGWTPNVVAVTGDATYTAIYDQKPKSYTVIWQDYDGTELEKDENVKYGTTPEFNGATPTRTGDAQYSYTFKGWSPAVDTVTGDITYTAVYEQTVNKYTITWKNGNETIKTEEVAYGETPVYSGETPVKASEGQYSYTFKGWTPEITAVTKNAEYTAEFNQTENTFTVTWLDSDGTTVLEKDENVAYGSKPSFDGTTPTKAEDEQYTYTFKGWSPEITSTTAITEDTTYTAVYETTVKTYTVTWLNSDGTTVLEKDENVAYGTKPSFDGKTPTKEEDDKNTYTFKGWSPEITDETTVTGNISYTAVYESKEKTYTVTWKNYDGTVLETDENVAYGTMPSYDGTTPTRAAEEGYTFTFAGWDPEILSVTGDVTYTATYSSSALVTHTITFDANGGEGTMAAQSFTTGVETKLSANAFTREGYKFTGWNTAADGSGASYAEGGFIVDLQKDLTLFAQWQIWNGWQAVGTLRYYYKDGELQKTGWTTIDGSMYYLDGETGTARTGGIFWLPYPEGYTADSWDTTNNDDYVKYGYDKNSYFLFDEEGIFESGKSGMYEYDSTLVFASRKTSESTLPVVGSKIWLVNGELIWHPGLVSDGSDYYYFPSGYFEDDGNATTLVTGDYYVSKTNDLKWPSDWGTGTFAQGKYTFDVDGKLLLRDGLTDVEGETYYYVKGAKTYAGLIQIDGNYYYINSSCKMVHDCDYSISKTNGLLPSGKYSFGSDGKMIQEDTKLDGIIKQDDGTWYYYVNGVKTYVGLIEIDGGYYYVNSAFQVIHDRNYFISKTNGLLPQKTYTFDSEGKLVRDRKGIIKESDSIWYYYVDGVKTYAGLIQIDGDYYYVNSSFQVIHGRSYYISKTNGLKSQGTYEFDNDGKMIVGDETLNGIVKQDDGTWYYYVNGIKTYAGLIQIDGDYYYVNSAFQVIHGRNYYISKANGLLPNKTYEFDDEGKLVQ